MPTYLCHGFRWHRRSIRYFILIQDIEDAAPDWVMAPQCSAALIENLYELFDFLPTRTLPQPRSKSPPSQGKTHGHTLSKDSFSRSRANSTDHRGSEERVDVNGKDKKTGNRNASRKRSISSLRRPKTSARDDELPPLPPLPPPPVKSPTILEDDGNGYSNTVSAVQLLEEFDPRDESRVSGPWAYVADYAVRIDTSVSVVEEMNRYETQMKADQNKAMSGLSDETGRRVSTTGSKKAGWLEKLRDELQRGESIRWYVVVCGDEERDPDPTPYAEEEEEEEEEDEDEEEYEVSSNARSQEPRRHRQSQSTQSTGKSVFENGFEFRIPELAGLAEPRSPVAKPDRRRAKTLPQPLPPPPPPPLPEKDFPVVPLPPHPIQVAAKMTAESYARPKTPKSSSGIRRLFFRRSTEGTG
ncbi:hypothetical protein F4809DRAFT_601271 [Biscogniauxia mediterranea]|nr:hypothetical protein F4809DRAFT_601271 [Biscogniauxia mediterranea]